MLTRTTTESAIRLTDKAAAFAMLVLAGLVGGGGLGSFMLFLYAGSFNLVNVGLDGFSALLFNTLLCLLFFFQHSSMARKSFYSWSERLMPAKYGGTLYAIASGIVVLALVVFWQDSGYTLLTVQGIARWLLRAIFFLAIINVIWTLSTGFLVLFRLQSSLDDLRGNDPRPAPLITHGPYRWVRHPLYLSSIMLIWTNPDLSLDRLQLNLLFTVWVIAGTLLEERKLVARFGQAYRSYQRAVPMLIPWRLRLGG